MGKNVRLVAMTMIWVIALFFITKMIFVRTVNYEIAGIKIPSRYNMLTGTVRPVVDYRGTGALPTIKAPRGDAMGLSPEQAVAAQFRWAMFEQWANSRPEYKGWESNSDVFKKASEDFRRMVESSGPKIRVIK